METQDLIKTPGKKGRVIKSKDVGQKVNQKVLGLPKDIPTEEKSGYIEKKKKTVADIMAGQNLFCKLNWYYPGGKDAFPYDPKMQYVTRCYPYANGGQLLVDEPKNENEAKLLLEKKAPLMRQLKFRYVILLRGSEVIHELG